MSKTTENEAVMGVGSWADYNDVIREQDFQVETG
jgi:hypothetical protein